MKAAQFPSGDAIGRIPNSAELTKDIHPHETYILQISPSTT